MSGFACILGTPCFSFSSRIAWFSVFLFFWERPPGLIKHVLTVLVFWSGVLVMPHLLSFVQEPQIVPLN